MHYITLNMRLINNPKFYLKNLNDLVIFNDKFNNINLMSFQYQNFQKLCYFLLNIKYSPYSLQGLKNYLLESDRTFLYNHRLSYSYGFISNKLWRFNI